MIYGNLPEYSDSEIEAILKSVSAEELAILALSVGEYHPNWKKAQTICLQLAEHPNEQVRANASLGLAYIARTKRRLDKHLVKPVLHRLLGECSEYRWRVIDSIEDINLFMEWNIAYKALKRDEE